MLRPERPMARAGDRGRVPAVMRASRPAERHQVKRETAGLSWPGPVGGVNALTQFVEIHPGDAARRGVRLCRDVYPSGAVLSHGVAGRWVAASVLSE